MSTTSDFYPNNPKPQKVVHSMVLRGGINITEAKQFESTGDLISKVKIFIFLSLFIFTNHFLNNSYS